MVERFVVFHLALKGVACAGDVDHAAPVGGLDVRPVFALAVDSPLGQLKEAVHGYHHVHFALGDCLCRYHPGHRRRRVALL